jgi:hypothetical protein
VSSLRRAVGPLQQSVRPLRMGCEHSVRRASLKLENVWSRTGARMKS